MPLKTDKTSPYSSPKFILSLLIITVLISISLNIEHISSILFPNSAQDNNQVLQEKISVLEKEIEELSKAPKIDTTIPPKEKKIVAFPSIDLTGNSCEDLEEQVREFFDYLDQQEYITSYNLENGSQAHFKNLIDKLLANPPIVVRETDSLFTILTNTAHFYRVLGKDNVLMAKDIIIRESEILESTFALFYQYSKTAGKCKNLNSNIQLPLPKLYEYAGFFLNTLGGQSYLFRRNSHIRLLIQYYCIMILDRANAEIINRHGIDIIPPLESIIDDIEIGETMIYKEQYLRTLRELRDKYQIHYEEVKEINPKANSRK